MSVRSFTRALSLLVWLLVLGARAEHIADCDGQETGYLMNPHSCSDFIYCDGENSIYCSGQCTEEIDCNSIIAAENAAASPPIVAATTPESDTSTATSLSTSTEVSSPSTEAATETTGTTRTPSIAVETTTPSTTAATESSSTESSTAEPTSTSPSVRETCVRGVNERFPFPANCNYYYNCIDGFLLLQQCPFGFGWDVNLKQCRELRKAECANSELS